MRTVSIIGAGNVAFHLTRAFVHNTIQVKQIYNRTLSKAEHIGEANKVRFTDKISELERADIFVIAASDQAIAELSLHIPYDDVMVVHTSGSMPLSELKGNYRKGVLYPLQTFTMGRVLEYDDIPFFIETENEEDSKLLHKFVSRVTTKIKEINSDQRLKMHMSAVWACNFVNHMYYIAEQMTEKSGLSFELLRPLIDETAAKIRDMSPLEAQTGPAKRNDQIIAEKHLNLIENPVYKDLYKSISDSISQIYNHEL